MNFDLITLIANVPVYLTNARQELRRLRRFKNVLFLLFVIIYNDSINKHILHEMIAYILQMNGNMNELLNINWISNHLSRHARKSVTRLHLKSKYTILRITKKRQKSYKYTLEE